VKGRPKLSLLLHLNLLVELPILSVVSDQYLIIVLLNNTMMELGIIYRVTWLIDLVLRRSVEVICVNVLGIQTLELHLRILSLLSQWRFVNMLPDRLLTRLQSILKLLFSWAEVIWDQGDVVYCSGGLKFVPLTSRNIDLTSYVHSLLALLWRQSFWRGSHLLGSALLRWSSLILHVHWADMVDVIELCRASWSEHLWGKEVMLVLKTVVSPLIIEGLVALLMCT